MKSGLIPAGSSAAAAAAAAAAIAVINQRHLAETMVPLAQLLADQVERFVSCQ